jgi:hypothetical protein
MHTQSNPAGLQPARPHGVASAPIWRLLAACRHTHMHTQHRRPARLLHVQKSARTNALHLHGRRACAGPRWSSSGRLTSTYGPLDGRLAPRHAAARRRRRAALSAVRGPMAAAAAAAAAELLGSAPTMAAAAERNLCENRTADSTAAPPGFRRRPHGRTPVESTERGGARGGLAACRCRRLVALARECRGGWSGAPLQAVKSTVLRRRRPAEPWK